MLTKSKLPDCPVTAALQLIGTMRPVIRAMETRELGYQQMVREGK